MRFLVDANLAERVARLLAGAGHDAVHVRELGMGAATDGEIFAKAADLGAVIVSEDTDFGAILARRKAPAPSLILIRSADPLTPDEQVSLILRQLPGVAVDLASGAILVLGRGRARLRRLPVVGMG